MPLPPPIGVDEDVFRLSDSFGQILLPQRLVKGLNNFDKTDREYSAAG